MECLSAVSILVLISFLTFGLVSAQNGNCSFIPISLPIKDTTLSNNAALRGISLGIGAPAQSFSVLPILEINNTYLYDADVGCATDNTQSYCITKQGGTFAQGKSRTFQSVANAGAAGAETSENVTIPSPSNWGQDNLGLGSDRAVQGFPLGLLDPNINTHSLVVGLGRAALGLGKDSAVLSKLKSAGFIGSRTFGLWWDLARATPAAQVEGSLVFGGYDAAKIKSGGKNHTGSITEATLCPSGMTITIASMVLNFPNGTNLSLLDPSLGGALLQAGICLQCSLVLMMPLDPYYQRFETLTNTRYIDRSMGINFFNMLYLSSDVYQGDLTITLDSGFSVRIPNSQLVQPDQKISDTGDVVSNTSVSNVNLYSLQDVMKKTFRC